MELPAMKQPEERNRYRDITALANITLLISSNSFRKCYTTVFGQ
jgi:hypothetical protein